MLREAGAAEVHVRISSPPITWPCFYGIDFASRAELIATGLGVDEVRQSIGADSLGYLSEDGMIAATEQPRERLCTACFTGVYPIELPDAHHLGKNLLERPGDEAAARAATVEATDTGADASSDGCEPGPDSEYERLLSFGDPGRQE
jgi:amidophosphoribosyltransferase